MSDITVIDTILTTAWITAWFANSVCTDRVISTLSRWSRSEATDPLNLMLRSLLPSVGGHQVRSSIWRCLRRTWASSTHHSPISNFEYLVSEGVSDWHPPYARIFSVLNFYTDSPSSWETISFP